MRSIATLYLVIIASAACKSASVPPTPLPAGAVTAASLGLPACGAAAPDTSDWRKVVAPGVEFCVPGDWQRGNRRDAAASASGQWIGRYGEWVQWAVGPWKEAAGVTLPYNESQSETGTIGGRPVSITTLILPDSYTTFAHWKKTASLPAVTISAYSSSTSERARVRKVIGTARFDAVSQP